MSYIPSYNNAFYPIELVLEDLRTGVQTTCRLQLEFVDGATRLIPLKGESQITGYSEGSRSHSGNKIAAKLPPGTKVVSIDTGDLPASVASFTTKDGKIDTPDLGCSVKADSWSEGKGLEEAP